MSHNPGGKGIQRTNLVRLDDRGDWMRMAWGPNNKSLGSLQAKFKDVHCTA
ncbi:TPA_asm: hypothetical protein HUJ06_000105 (mitochondrion) [Nelumbo nucifera]|uniref:Uncharacterized protein n=1 Tax=Nelumbo nucifera TaxID=4432 RepID=A0A822XZ36_NELNU|nr:TPA_asm: hypothetical protein HUJ06_026991 [Nelumbo nucifera]DAD25596.1 TPA_asm: hypothetical protein HUJ06_027060 [Nelumbo nucifera]DAD25647.1 TPA_asm: hypothetical protein HUJ06_027111 [Nelumbo nucifera]DAD25658.1 TPA_asm: hypothetical protein HUJ06_027122 [Nelumbo nucifera]DAD49316.1 TPA_asm: hypothetical protein HUJ06_032037 [Nelumbo nucifera]